MKKKLLIVSLILIIIISAGVFYLNKVYLPVKIKSLIIQSLQEATQKKVSLESLHFNIFKGLVLRNLKIFDGTKTIANFTETDFAFLIWPIFKKRIVIPIIAFKSPVIFLERRADNTFNLADLFTNKATKEKGKFGIFVYRIKVRNGRIDFQDDTLSPVFTKSMENLNLNVALALPASVRFNLKSNIAADPRINISAIGEFNIPQNALIAKITIADFSPREFAAYYRNFAVSISFGTIDSLINLVFKDNIVNADCEAKIKGLTFSKDKITAKLNSDLKANLKYSLKDKFLTYSGNAMVSGSNIQGLQFTPNVDNIIGEIKFSNSGLVTEKLQALIFGIPVAAKANLSEFKSPLLNINIVASPTLNSLQKILADKFKFVIPGDIQGDGKLSLNIESKFYASEPLSVNGYLDIANGTLKLNKVNSPFESINGRLALSQNQLQWLGLTFQYLNTTYTTAGTLTNFQSPGVQFALSSKDLSLESIFAVNHQLINLSKCDGRYLNSELALSGKINTEDPKNLQVDIGGGLILDLEDIKNILNKFKNQIEQIKPDGIVHAKFNLTGNINDLKSCAIATEFSSPSISIFGLRSQEFFLNYNQENGLADIPLVHFDLYGGTVDLSAKMNLNTENLPFWVSADIENVKIEKLKIDTPAKDKDIAGTIKAQVKINGFSRYPEQLNGAGTIFITDGKLWELNLFKGLGELLFVKDFARIIFNEGYCGFTIQDKSVFTDNLKLKSALAELDGSCKIGFDGSLGGSLDVQINDEMAPLSGTLKDVATAIIGKASRFGVIKISGTLKEPKFKFKAAIPDIIKSFKDAIFKKHPNN